MIKCIFDQKTMILILLTLLTANLLSQQISLNKQTFVYKQVKGHQIKANIFIPGKGKNHPVVIYFHGGGFIFGNRDVGLATGLRDSLLAHGFAVISGDYRLAPETKLDEIQLDIRDCVHWVQQNGTQHFQIDTSRIAVAGGSAAGYLALTTGYTVSPPPQAIIAISTPTDFSKTPRQTGDLSILEKPGPYDIVSNRPVSYGDYDTRITLWRFLGTNQLALFEIFGFDVSKHPERLKHFMLTEHIQTGYPPTLLMHAKQDPLAPLRQVEQFYQFLQNSEIPAEFYLTETGHSTRLLKQNPDAVTAIIQFLKRYL